MRNDFMNRPGEEHESYGLMGFSRGTCNPPRSLFGSNIKHGNLITMTIHAASVKRDYQRDWNFARERLIQVTMSATQFADAITSMNIGDGVPVTLDFVKGDKWNEKAHSFRQTPPETDFKKRATGELKAEMGELAERLDELSKDATDILERKGTTIKAGEKEKLLKDIQYLIQEVRGNIPFAHECFQEAVERTVVEAKGEIDASYQTLRERLGDKAIAEHKLEVPMLEEKPVLPKICDTCGGNGLNKERNDTCKTCDGTGTK